MDNSYFIIRIVNKRVIEIHYCEYKDYLKKNSYPVCFYIYLHDFDIIISLLMKYIKVTNCSTEHKVYLGKEIFKAQISCNLHQQYIQD